MWAWPVASSPRSRTSGIWPVASVTRFQALQPAAGLLTGRRRGYGGEAFGEFGVGEVGGEGGSGKTHRLALGIGVIGEGEVVAADVAGGEALDLHQDVGASEEGEELLGGRGGGDGGAGCGAQAFAGGCGAAGAVGFLLLGTGGAFGGGAVPAQDLAQAVCLLDGGEFVVGV